MLKKPSHFSQNRNNVFLSKDTNKKASNNHFELRVILYVLYIVIVIIIIIPYCPLQQALWKCVNCHRGLVALYKSIDHFVLMWQFRHKYPTFHWLLCSRLSRLFCCISSVVMFGSGHCFWQWSLDLTQSSGWFVLLSILYLCKTFCIISIK